MLSIYRKLIPFFSIIALLAAPLRADEIPDPFSDLSVSLSSVASAPLQTVISYVFKVKNSGPNASEASDLSIQLPEKGELISTQTTQGTCAPLPTDVTVISCHLGKLENAAEAQVVVQWKTPDEEVTLEIAADVSAAASIDENANNDHTSAFTEVKEVITDPFADLKVFVKPILSVSAGNVINYTMEVENLGPDAAATTHLSMIIPRIGQYVSSQSEQGTCAIAQPDVLDCDLQNIASGRIIKIGLRWKAPNEATTLRFVASVSGQAIDTHSENNAIDFETVVEPPPPGPTPGSSPATPKAEGNWGCSMGVPSASASGYLWAVILLTLPLFRGMRNRR